MSLWLYKTHFKNSNLNIKSIVFQSYKNYYELFVRHSISYESIIN